MAHVHDGYQTQTNSVRDPKRPAWRADAGAQDGRRINIGQLINRIEAALPEIQKLIPKGVTLRPIFDQSILVEGILEQRDDGWPHGWLNGGPDDPAVPRQLAADADHHRFHPPFHNCRRARALSRWANAQYHDAGRLALAVGILVDNATVVIENVERNVHLGKPLEQAIARRDVRGRSADISRNLVNSRSVRASLSARGTAKYLFSPLSLSVIISLCASLLLSFTLVPFSSVSYAVAGGA